MTLLSFLFKHIFPIRHFIYLLFSSFFFSSRRRHTISLCDWSSDVCSSDLKQKTAYEITRLNSSHTVISYAVFCLRKEENTYTFHSQTELECHAMREKRRKVWR